MAYAEMKGATVRVRAATKLKLDELESKTGFSQQYLLERAVDLLAYDLQIRQLNSDLADLVENEVKLSHYKEVSSRFDGSIMEDFG